MSKAELDKEEFLALSDQKAADWRAITQMSTSFLAFAGALFAAGVGQRAAFVVVLVPVPLFFGVFHMIRNARLQLQMTTYLAVFAPKSTASWERDIAEVRPRFWSHPSRPQWIMDARERARDHQVIAHVLRFIAEPSAWHTWIEIALIVGFLIDLVPLLAEGYENACAAFALGLALLVAGTAISIVAASRVEPTRELWTQLWSDYKAEVENEPLPG